MDLSTQIREYSRDLDATQVPLTVDEIRSLRRGGGAVRTIHPSSVPPDLRGHRQRKGWAVAAAVFVAVVLTGVLVGVLRSDSTAPVVDTPPSTVAPPSTAAPPTTAPQDLEAAPPTTVADAEAGSGPVLEWEEIDGITSISDFAQAIFDGQGFLVIQQDCNEGTMVLLSSSQDGVLWDEASYTVDPPPGDACYNWAATPQLALGASGDRAVRIDRTTGEVTHIELPTSLGWTRPIAAGNAFFVVNPNGSSRTMVSPDGLSWTETRIDAPLDPSDPGLRDVASLGGEYLAMSSNDEHTTSGYLSPDGVNWTPTDCCTLEGSLWNPWGPGLLPWNGGAVAVIQDCATETPAVLYHVTSDGVTALPHPPFSRWSPFSRPVPCFGGDVRAGGLGIIVMPGTLDVFFSPDGLTWTVSPAPDQVGGSGEGAVGPDAIIMLKWNAGDLTLLRGTIKDR